MLKTWTSLYTFHTQQLGTHLAGERTARHVLPVEAQLDGVVLGLARRKADRVRVLTLGLRRRRHAPPVDRHLQISGPGLGGFHCRKLRLEIRYNLESIKRQLTQEDDRLADGTIVDVLHLDRGDVVDLHRAECCVSWGCGVDVSAALEQMTEATTVIHGMDKKTAVRVQVAQKNTTTRSRRRVHN